MDGREGKVVVGTFRGLYVWAVRAALEWAVSWTVLDRKDEDFLDFHCTYRARQPRGARR